MLRGSGPGSPAHSSSSPRTALGADREVWGSPGSPRGWCCGLGPALSVSEQLPAAVLSDRGLVASLSPVTWGGVQGQGTAPGLGCSPGRRRGVRRVLCACPLHSRDPSPAQALQSHGSAVPPRIPLGEPWPDLGPSGSETGGGRGLPAEPGSVQGWAHCSGFLPFAFLGASRALWVLSYVLDLSPRDAGVVDGIVSGRSSALPGAPRRAVRFPEPAPLPGPGLARQNYRSTRLYCGLARQVLQNPACCKNGDRGVAPSPLPCAG